MPITTSRHCMLNMSRAGVCVLLALVSSGAFGQDSDQAGAPGKADSGPGPEEAPEALPEFQREAAIDPMSGVDWAEDHRWVNTGLRRRISGLASLPDGVTIAVTEDGEVHVRGEGRSWRLVLPATGGLGSADDIEEEQLLLDAEAAVQDFSDDEGDDLTEDPEEVDSGAADGTTSVGTVGEDVNADGGDPSGTADSALAQDALEAGLLDAAERAARDAVRQPGVWVTASRSAIVSRADGSWLSRDGGQTWAPIPTLPRTLDIVAFPGFPDELVAATVDGILQSGNGGRSWFTVESSLSGDRVFDLETDEEWVYAGADDGLYRSRDGMRWARAQSGQGATQAVFSVAADPAWKGGLWLATAAGVLRSDDAGETTRRAGRNPLIGTRELVALPGPGRVLAAGTTGVWESSDGGVRWAPVVQGLPGPDQRALVVDAQSPLLGGAYGVFRLGRTVDAPDEVLAGDVPIATPVSLPTLGELVGVSLRRSGVAYDPVMVRRGVVRALFTPSLTTFARLETDHYRLAQYDLSRTSEVLERDWTVGLTLCFGACSGWVGAATDVDATEAQAATPELVTIGDEVYDINDQGSYSAAAANAVSGLTRYRGFLAESLTELYHTRLRLEAQRGGLHTLPLRERVEYALSVLETDAQLDAYTDGYYYRVLAARNSQAPAGAPSME